MNFESVITIVGVIIAFFSGVWGFLSWWEARKQRLESGHPILVFKSQEKKIEIIKNKKGEYLFAPDISLVDCIVNFSNLNLNFRNIGNGPIKELHFDWNFASDLLTEIKKCRPTLFEIILSELDPKGRLYFFELKSDEFAGYSNETPFSFYPYKENQNDPVYQYREPKINLSINERSETRIKREFGVLTLLYGITKFKSTNDINHHYFPQVEFSANYRDSKGRIRKNKFALACQIYVEENVNSNEEKVNLFFSYEVNEIH